MIEPAVLATTSVWCFAAAIVIGSLELLLARPELQRGALLAVSGRRPQRPWNIYEADVLLLALRLAGAAALFGTPLSTAAAPWLVGGLLALQVWYNARFSGTVHHSSDTMLAIGLAAMLLAALDGPGHHLTEIGLVFLGVHSTLAYACAGTSKAAAPEWRDGRMLSAIMSTWRWRQEHIGRLLQAQPRLATATSLGVIGLELLLALSVVLPPPAQAVILVLGVVFHVLIAVLMGLHNFAWVFVGTYPALYFLNATFWRALES